MLEKIPKKIAPKALVDALIFLYQKGKFEDVLSRSSLLVQQYPDTPVLHNILGEISFEKGNKDQAIQHFRKVINLKPCHPHGYNNLGVVLSNMQIYDEAKFNFKKAIELKPDYAEAYNNLGNVHKALEEDDQALKYYKKSVQLNPHNYETLNNLGIELINLKKLEEAKKIFISSTKLNPNCAETHYNLGKIYTKFKNYKIAEQKFKKAIYLKNNYLEAYNELAYICRKVDNYHQAILYYNKALNINNNIPEIHHNLALAFSYVGNIKKIISHQKIASFLNSDKKEFHIPLLFHSNYSPDMCSEEIFGYYKQYNDRFALPLQKKWKPFTQTKTPKSKLKIGYVSPDFKDHSIKNFLMPVLAHHDHQKFEIYAFVELKKADLVTQKYKSYVDHWIRTDGMDDDQLAQTIRELKIDILIDLAGHTVGNRLSVFALKPAPVSLSWWIGYGYTTGLSAIDYFLTNEVMAPKGSEHLFSEQLWNLNNHSVVWNPEKKTMGKVSPLPASTNNFITFGTLTRVIRINDQVIQTWAQILHRVKNSKLVINSVNFINNSKTIHEFKQKFQAHGISAERLDFYFESPPWDTMREIDIALDCFPHNSNATLIEHLYMGNPFITYSHRPSVGKIGASILTTLRHPEWIATSEEDYIDKAVTLALDTKKLAQIRNSLRTEMEASPMMDPKVFIHELENTYRAMWKKWCSSQLLHS